MTLENETPSSLREIGDRPTNVDQWLVVTQERFSNHLKDDNVAQVAVSFAAAERIVGNGVGAGFFRRRSMVKHTAERIVSLSK